MGMTAADIEALLRREGSSANPNQDDEARQRRTSLLAPVLTACQEVWESQPEKLDIFAEKLGDSSRDVAWRGPFGDSGILEFFLRSLTLSGSQSLRTHALRLIGNSCADMDENRERVVKGDHIPTIVNYLHHHYDLILFTVSVLFNILVDYEPAQLQASACGLSRALIKRLSLSNVIVDHAHIIPYFFKILALLAPHESEGGRADPDTVNILLGMAAAPPFSTDVDGFVNVVSTALLYLANEAFQKTAGTKPVDLKLFLSTFRHDFDEVKLNSEEEDDSGQQLKKLRSSLLASLADVTGEDGFAARHPPESEAPQILLSWLADGDNPRLQVASCLALGNLSRSDDVSIALVQTHRAHEPLVGLLSDPKTSDAQLLHSALSFLKNLAVPAVNKEYLAALLDPPCLPRLLAIDTSPQVQFAAVSLFRLLLVGCKPNVWKVCHEEGLAAVLALYRRSDAEPTRLEAARAVASACRVMQTMLDDERGDGPYRQREEVAGALAFLVTQEKWPILRSEAWFVFALMCRSAKDAAIVVDVLRMQGVAEALSKALTGHGVQDLQKQDGDAQMAALMDGLEIEPKQVEPKHKENMQRVDRENALVMCTELLRTAGDQMPDEEADLLRDLIRQGAEIVSAQKPIVDTA